VLKPFRALQYNSAERKGHGKCKGSEAVPTSSNTTTGIGPNPYFGYCTLCGCKFEGAKTRKNIVQLAEGDWVVGTGGADPRKSAGHGKFVYAMRVDKKLTRWKYFNDSRFEQKKPSQTGTYQQTRGDNEDPRKMCSRIRKSASFW
jgi:Nucleotide modification associated domain 2